MSKNDIIYKFKNKIFGETLSSVYNLFKYDISYDIYNLEIR